jgi:hypothetical protein
MNDLASVENVAHEVEQTLRRYREREKELYAELVRVTARFDERVRDAMVELHKHVETLDALQLEKGSESQIRRKALRAAFLQFRFHILLHIHSNNFSNNIVIILLTILIGYVII